MSYVISEAVKSDIHGSADFIIILYVLGKKYMVTSNNTRPAKAIKKVISTNNALNYQMFTLILMNLDSFYFKEKGN